MRSIRRRKERLVPVTDDVMRALEEQMEAFRKKFGREPKGSDPVFFDPDAEQPRPVDPRAVEDALLSAMKAARIRPELIHATRRTGLIVSEANYDKLTDEDRAAWQAALDEYEDLRKRSS